jgi:hypothetical protein
VIQQEGKKKREAKKRNKNVWEIEQKNFVEGCANGNPIEQT